MYLFFDTETTGLPKNWKAPVTDLDNWPRVLQLGFQLYDKDRNLEHERNILIQPPGEEGFDISAAALKTHGISNEMCFKDGIPIKDALRDFYDCLAVSKYLLAHNMSYDRNVLGAESLRTGMKAMSRDYTVICTKDASTDFCAIPGYYGQFKWPKLQEVHQKLFGENFEGAHDALADVAATARCFFELVDREVIILT